MQSQSHACKTSTQDGHDAVILKFKVNMSFPGTLCMHYYKMLVCIDYSIHA